MGIPTLSFEFFPPKTPGGIQSLIKTAQRLAQTEPEFFSVTFGAGGSTRTDTLEAVTALQKIGIETAPHLACIGLTRAELVDMVRIYQSLNIKRLVALRGDLPSGAGYFGELRFANELVHLIQETAPHFFHIEVAAYPEVHPQAVTASADILYLKQKIEAGANSAITQYFFNADAYFYFRDTCSKEGITVPIVPGIMPITQFTKLARFSDLCGAEIPQWIRKRLEQYADDLPAIEAFGLEVVSHLCQQLIRGGATGLHFYTLNQAEPSLKVIEQLKNI